MGTKITALGIRAFIDALDDEGKVKAKTVSQEVAIYESDFEKYPDLMDFMMKSLDIPGNS